MHPITRSLLTVKELTGYLHSILESDDLLRDLWVQGEISNFTHASSGHVYFSLKDASASIRCAMWRQYTIHLPADIKDGQSVEVHGYVDIYEAGGQLQFYADVVRSAGEGLLYLEFLRLKAQLEAEGLFDPSKKRSLPAFPLLIGIVTSPTAAALQDILNVLQRRFPLAEVIISPTPVQGEEAPAGIVSAIQRAVNTYPDVIILARGGGSLEDLWAFNDERVARAIRASPIPIITGIGHETDFTIADFVSDLRAPTPTAAAELATPNKNDLILDLRELSAKIHRIIRHTIDNITWQNSVIHTRLMQYLPAAYLDHQVEKLSDLTRTLLLAYVHQTEISLLNLKELTSRLGILSPNDTLKRGFALVTDIKQGKLISHVKDVADQMPIHVQVSDGSFHATVNKE